MRAPSIVDVSGSGRWCSHRAVPRNHGCLSLVSGVMQYHAIIDVVIGRPRHALSPSNRVSSTVMNLPTSCPNSHVVVRLYQFIITFLCSHFVHTVAPRKHVI